MAETRDIRAEALSAARRQFAAGKPLDVNALATELGVDRTTLFRRAGNGDNRDRILPDVFDSGTAKGVVHTHNWTGADSGHDGRIRAKADRS